MSKLFLVLLCSFLLLSFQNVIYNTIFSLKSKVFQLASPSASYNQTLYNLKTQNISLKRQIDSLYEWLLFDQKTNDLVDKTEALKQQANSSPHTKDFFLQKSEFLKNRSLAQLQSISAKVIHRTRLSWYKYCWINVGLEDNKKIGQDIVSIDSPVVQGNALIGIIDKVEKKKSRVLLITDNSNTISIQLLNKRDSNEKLVNLLKQASLLAKNEDRSPLLNCIDTIRKKYPTKTPHNITGEVNGICDLNIFNGDIMLSARLFCDPKSVKLETGDILVTSGLDEIAPQGVEVGIIADITEDICSYNLKLLPACDDINKVYFVSVLPKEF